VIMGGPMTRKEIHRCGKMEKALNVENVKKMIMGPSMKGKVVHLDLKVRTREKVLERGRASKPLTPKK